MQSRPYELCIHSNWLLISWAALLLLLLCVCFFLLLFLLLLGLCIFMNKWQQYSPLSNCSHCIILNNVTQSEIYKCFIRKFKPGPVLSLHSLIRILLLFPFCTLALPGASIKFKRPNHVFFFSHSLQVNFPLPIFLFIPSQKCNWLCSAFFVGSNFRKAVIAKKIVWTSF